MYLFRIIIIAGGTDLCTYAYLCVLVMKIETKTNRKHTDTRAWQLCMTYEE